MKKILSAAVIGCLLFTIACRKSTANTGSWTFEGVNYTAASAVLTDTSLIATSGSAINQGSTLTFFFPVAPSHSANYQVVNYTQPLDSDQLYIRFVNSSTSFYYFSTGNDNVTARVTVSSAGKVTVSLPPVYMESYAAATPDSGQLTATITQQ